MKSRKVPPTMKDKALSSGSVSKKPKVKNVFHYLCCSVDSNFPTDSIFHLSNNLGL